MEKAQAKNVSQYFVDENKKGIVMCDHALLILPPFPINKFRREASTFQTPNNIIQKLKMSSTFFRNSILQVITLNVLSFSVHFDVADFSLTFHETSLLL